MTLLEPNWSTPVQVTQSYRTDVITSRSRMEQRRALRKLPRKNISFTALTQDLPGFRAARTNAAVSIPDPTRVYRGGPAPAWLVTGAAVFVDGTATTYSGQTGEIRPALTGLLTSPKTTLLTNAVATVPVELAVTPGSETPTNYDQVIHVHDGREVFTRRPNWANTVSLDFDWPVETVDFGHGRIETFRPVTFDTETVQATYLGLGAADVQEIENFFHRVTGQLGEFWLPSGINDLPMTAGSATGSTDLHVTGDYTGAIAVFMRDGRRLYRNYDSGTVDSPWLFDLNPEDVDMVCRMTVARLATDNLTMEWLTSDVAQTQIAIQSLPPSDAEDAVADLDGAAQWLLEVWGEGALSIFDALDVVVNIEYPAIWFMPEAWVTWSADALGELDRIVNIRWPAVTG